jgi:hypothetical protein
MNNQNYMYHMNRLKCQKILSEFEQNFEVLNAMMDFI